MKGNSTKGRAWATAVRATFFDSHKTTQPEWKLSFLDHISRTKETVFIKGDIALPFGLFDNRDLRAFVDLDSVSDSSTFDTFHVHSPSAKAIKRIAKQLDEVLHKKGFKLDIPDKASKATILQKMKMLFGIFSFKRIKNPTKKIRCAKNILTNPDTSPPVAFSVWEEVAEVYFKNAEAIHLAEPIFRALNVKAKKLNLRRSGIYSAYYVGNCLFIKKQWEEAIQYLEEALSQGFDSPCISEIIEMSRIKLNEKNS